MERLLSNMLQNELTYRSQKGHGQPIATSKHSLVQIRMVLRTYCSKKVT
jgi:hypothetical protein